MKKLTLKEYQTICVRWLNSGICFFGFVPKFILWMYHVLYVFCNGFFSLMANIFINLLLPFGVFCMIVSSIGVITWELIFGGINIIRLLVACVALGVLPFYQTYLQQVAHRDFINSGV